MEQSSGEQIPGPRGVLTNESAKNIIFVMFENIIFVMLKIFVQKMYSTSTVERLQYRNDKDSVPRHQ